jgi:putative endopeptidase
MGSQFSGSGKLENWWEPGVAKQFNGKKQCLINQYDKYEVLPGVHVNGKLTLGENIADLGGVKLAFHAYKKLRKGKKPIVAGGYSEDQQFFLAVAQAWCTKSREKTSRMLINVDPHSPPKFRVNGSVTSMPEFAEAFSCKANTPMNPADRCTVW